MLGSMNGSTYIICRLTDPSMYMYVHTCTTILFFAAYVGLGQKIDDMYHTISYIEVQIHTNDLIDCCWHHLILNL